MLTNDVAPAFGDVGDSWALVGRLAAGESRSVGLRFDMEIAEGFNMNLTAGLSFSDCGGMVFRKLPFSLEYQAGDMQGVRLGGNLAKR